jgi:H+/Cl- antiporter ClcA
VVHRFAPEAAGSGIPQVMAANETEYVGENCKLVDRLLSMRMAGVKLLSSLFGVLAGGANGREGPTIQIGASVFHFFGKRFRRFLPDTNEHIWVVAGAAAGLASAFNTPLGGIVYAVEELGIVHFHKIRSALISAVIVSGLMSQWLIGSYLYLGLPEIQAMKFSLIPVIAVTGALSGFLGAVFGLCLWMLMQFRRKLRSTSQLALLAIVCGLAMAALSLLDPRASGPGTRVIGNFLFEHQTSSLKILAIRFISPMVSYISGAAGGIFAPALAMGAAIGAFLADFLSVTNNNLLVLVGMTGFLTGVVRTPFTSFILVLEMTDRHSAVFPMMLGALVAQWVAHAVTPHSFYELAKHRYLPQPLA